MGKKKKIKILRIRQWFKRPPKEIQNGEITCKNCETVFEGNYCPQCGQSIKDFDKPFSFIFYNFLGDFFAFDTRFFKTFIALLFKPGLLTKEYFDGRRVKYAPPLRIFIFASFILFLLLQGYTNRGLTTMLDKSFPDSTKIQVDSASIALADSILDETQAAVDTIQREGLNIKLNFETFRDTRDLRDGLGKLAAQFEENLKETNDPEERKKLRNYISLCHSPEQVTARILKYLS